MFKKKEVSDNIFAKKEVFVVRYFIFLDFSFQD